MLRALRSRCWSLTTLAAFLLVQPAAVCAALCLFGGHHAAAHAMPGTEHGTPALGNAACHSSHVGTVERSPFQALSPMAPTRAQVIAAAPAHRVHPVWALPTPPRLVSRTAEPPPPRAV